jgi:hypothetical protein
MSIQDDITALELLRADFKLNKHFGPKWEIVKELDLMQAAYHAVVFKEGSEDLRQHLRYICDEECLLRYEEVVLLREIRDELKSPRHLPVREVS